MKIKKIPKNFVICDGMTEQTNWMDFILLVVGLASIYLISKIALIIYRYKKVKK